MWTASAVDWRIMPRLIRTIACASDDDWFATAHFEDKVTTWSLKQRRRVCDLDDTGFDFGGSRLCMLGGDEPRVVVGSYEREKICAYSAITGAVIWNRDAMGGMGSVLASNGDILVKTENKIIHRLDASSGKTLGKFRGIRHVLSSPWNSLAIFESKPYFSLWSVNENSKLWHERLESFSILCAAFSPDAVLIAEPAHWQPDNVPPGPVRCFSLDGKLLWSSPRDPKWHTINAAWNADLSSWIGVDMGYNIRRNPRSLVQWSVDGEILSKQFCGESIESQLFPSGRYLVTSDGQVRSVPSLELVWQFSEDLQNP